MIPTCRLAIMVAKTNPVKPIGFDIVDDTKKTIGVICYADALAAIIEYETLHKAWRIR